MAEWLLVATSPLEVRAHATCAIMNQIVGLRQPLQTPLILARAFARVQFAPLLFAWSGVCIRRRRKPDAGSEMLLRAC